MTWATVGGAVIGGVVNYASSQNASDAASSANKDAQMQQLMMQQQIMKMLAPYRKAGTKGLAAQLDLIGLNGAKPQQSAIDALELSPYFTSQVEQGENALRQNASATGGLRGGNTAAALAQFRPQMLAQTIENQYAKLAGLAGAGQNAAVQQGGFNQNSVNAMSGLLQNQGMIGAQSAIAQGTNISNLISGLTQAYGQYKAQNMQPSNTGSGSSFAPHTDSSGGYWNLGAGLNG